MNCSKKAINFDTICQKLLFTIILILKIIKGGEFPPKTFCLQIISNNQPIFNGIKRIAFIGDSLVMGDDDNCRSGVVERPKYVDDVFGRLAVKCACRFVG